MYTDRDRDSLYVNAIKLAYGSLHYGDISIIETFKLSITHLRELYLLTGELEYLRMALLHMRAYVQMGFDFSIHEALFMSVLDCLKMNKMAVYENYTYSGRRIKPCQTHIRGMIGSWKKSVKNPRSVSEVVSDIIEKVQTKKREYLHIRISVERHSICMNWSSQKNIAFFGMCR